MNTIVFFLFLFVITFGKVMPSPTAPKFQRLSLTNVSIASYGGRDSNVA